MINGMQNEIYLPELHEDDQWRYQYGSCRVCGEPAVHTPELDSDLLCEDCSVNENS